MLTLWIVALAPASALADPPDDETYILDHPDAPWWLSAQLNVILQAQPGFAARTTGPHSFDPNDHVEASYITTIYGAYELTPSTALAICPESAGGQGLSDGFGIAGYPNLDTVHAPDLGATPYLARAYIDQIIPLSDQFENGMRGPLRPWRKLPTRRLEIRAGKFSVVDVFDLNGSAVDTHVQFMNWTIDNNGAYDYASDTRLYTLGGSVEYAEPGVAIRFGEFLMPTTANGYDYDYDVVHARGENAEIEVHGAVGEHPGIVRLLGYMNHARMGNYDEAIAGFRSGADSAIDVTKSRRAGRIKYGAGLNIEQEIAANAFVFARLGWNEGQNESFANTEVDNTVLVGIDLRGELWQRPGDRMGLAVVTNGISASHREYLHLGGEGFLLGDGGLQYGRESIFEAFYTARAVRGVFPAIDIQVVENPGYNIDRGPVVIGSLRLHIEL